MQRWYPVATRDNDTDFIRLYFDKLNIVFLMNISSNAHEHMFVAT